MPKCHYAKGENTDASIIMHDIRGCVPVCHTHAHWRRFYCSRVGGHSKDCRTPEVHAHATSTHTHERLDDSMFMGGTYVANIGMRDCGPYPETEFTRADKGEP